MPDRFEFKVWAEGEARDADGRLLDSNGTVIEPNETDQVDTDQESE